jgi:MFS family permease
MADSRTTGTMAGGIQEGVGQEEKKVIFASSLGTVFEWYDFYLYATLAPFFAALFFPSGNETAALLSAFATYAAGFLVRPFGAIVFGRIGDLVGRKYTFLVTIVFMGLATFLVGLLPTYASIGWAAPCGWCRAWRWVANMAVQRPTSPSTHRTNGAATTPAGSRPPRHSASSSRWRSSAPRAW